MRKNRTEAFSCWRRRGLLRGELRTSCSLQVPLYTARMPYRCFADRLRIFAKQKCGSEGCTDVPRTTTARNCSISRESKNAEAFFFCWRRSVIPPHCSDLLYKSKGEKRPSRFSFINTLVISPRGTSHDARQGCRVALSHNICAFYAAKCGSERYKDVTRTDTARNRSNKSGVEKR